MKKLSLILATGLLTASSAFAGASLFKGYYFGGNLGWTQRTDKIHGDSTGLLKKNKKNNGLVYGLYTGYGQTNRGFYLGVELGVEHDNASKNVTYSIPATSTDPAETLITKYDRGVVISLAPRIGMLIEQRNLVYVKLGVEYSRDKSKVTIKSASGSESISYSKNQFVFFPSIGWERNIDNHWMLRAEYGYNLGGKITKHQGGLKYTAHVAKLGLGYKF